MDDDWTSVIWSKFKYVFMYDWRVSLVWMVNVECHVTIRPYDPSSPWPPSLPCPLLLSPSHALTHPHDDLTSPSHTPLPSLPLPTLVTTIHLSVWHISPNLPLNYLSINHKILSGPTFNCPTDLRLKIPSLNTLINCIHNLRFQYPSINPQFPIHLLIYVSIIHISTLHIISTDLRFKYSSFNIAYIRW